MATVQILLIIFILFKKMWGKYVSLYTRTTVVCFYDTSSSYPEQWKNPSTFLLLRYIELLPNHPSLPPYVRKWVQRIKYPHWNELKSSSDIDYENVEYEKIVYILFLYKCWNMKGKFMILKIIIW